MASLSIKEYEELRTLSRIEPVGSDAIVTQMALVVSSLANINVDRAIVYSTFALMSPEQLMAMAKSIPKINKDGHGSGTRHDPES